MNNPVKTKVKKEGEDKNNRNIAKEGTQMKPEETQPRLHHWSSNEQPEIYTDTFTMLVCLTNQTYLLPQQRN